jgi:hypothetical protein
MIAAGTRPPAPSARLLVELRAVGGQSLTSMVALLARRLLPHARSLTVRETHGMAQRGGVVSASIDFCHERSLASPGGAANAAAPGDESRSGRPTTVLLALELTEGARALPRLEAGDHAFVATCVIRPPGTWAPARGGWPTPAELEVAAGAAGVHLRFVEATRSTSWGVLQAAIQAGVIP